jgi:hypothetical protein
MFSDASAQLLERLPSPGKTQLKELWQKSFGRPPSPRLRRELQLKPVTRIGCNLVMENQHKLRVFAIRLQAEDLKETYWDDIG